MNQKTNPMKNIFVVIVMVSLLMSTCAPLFNVSVQEPQAAKVEKKEAEVQKTETKEAAKTEVKKKEKKKK